MTQDELKLVLDALKWCHGGEPCGTSEAIAVVEKALGNVATNDTSKEYVDEMQKQRHEQEPVALETVYETIIQWDEGGGKRSRRDLARRIIDLYTHPPQRTEQNFCSRCGKRTNDIHTCTPPQRTWVGLTNDELTDLFYNTNLGQQSAVAQAIALLKERNT